MWAMLLFSFSENPLLRVLMKNFTSSALGFEHLGGSRSRQMADQGGSPVRHSRSPALSRFDVISREQRQYETSCRVVHKVEPHGWFCSLGGAGMLCGRCVARAEINARLCVWFPT